jgi:site-specific DNA-methyltransferase (adenine-specific)
MKKIKCELYNDNYANFKSYNIPAKAQLVIADIPYNLGKMAYGSNPSWYIGGDNKNGESKLAGKSFFRTDENFKVAEFFHFCNRLLKKEPKQRNEAPAMIVFCAWQQIPLVQKYGAEYGFRNSYPIWFIKKSSTQALKANMKIVGATECAMVLYRDKLPKFRNEWQEKETGKKMIVNWFEWENDNRKLYPKCHPTQKPIGLLKKLIKTFTDPGDVVIDPTAGSGSTLRASYELGRPSYGFEVDKKFYRDAKEKMLNFERLEEIDGIPLFEEV